MDTTETIDRLQETRVPAGWDGITVLPGWFPLVIDALTRIEALEPSYEIHQVKEKFGGLRLYVEPHTPEVELIVNEAEELSQRTCELCGEPGTAGGRGWIKTFCPAHHAENDRRRSAAWDQAETQPSESASELLDGPQEPEAGGHP